MVDALLEEKVVDVDRNDVRKRRQGRSRVADVAFSRRDEAVKMRDHGGVA